MQRLTKVGLSGISLFVFSATLGIEDQRLAAQVLCVGDGKWLNNSGALDGSEPIPPDGECGFYQRSWEAFLYITQPKDARPAFLSYDTYLSVFENQTAPGPANAFTQIMEVRTPEPAGPVFDGGVNQAFSSAVIDKNGNPLYYSVEIDPLFSKFIRDNKLNDLAVLRDPAVQIPEIPNGSVEIKASWQIVDDPAKFNKYIVSQAKIFPLKQSGEGVDVDRTQPPRDVSVALLGIHVVFKVENHPEFIWATFEHVDDNGEFDLVPRSAFLPEDIVDKNAPVSPKDFTLYSAGTSYDQGNLEQLPMTLQSDGTIDKRSSIYRAYPFSQKRIAEDPEVDPLEEDDDIAALNKSVKDLFKANAPADIRQNYKLVGSVWLTDGKQDFHAGTRIKEDDLSGERGLSNAAIESMTQTSFPHCFSCHNPIKGAGLPSRDINVSHLFKKYSSEH